MHFKEFSKLETWQTTIPYLFIATIIGPILIVLGLVYPPPPPKQGGPGMMDVLSLWPQYLAVLSFIAALLGFRKLGNMRFIISEERKLRIELRQAINGLDSHLIFAGKLHLLADDCDRLVLELQNHHGTIATGASQTFATLKDKQKLFGRIVGYQRLVASVSIPGLSDKFRNYRIQDGGIVSELVDILVVHQRILNNKAAEEADHYCKILSGK